jgi:hypothetical protein
LCLLFALTAGILFTVPLTHANALTAANFSYAQLTLGNSFNMPTGAAVDGSGNIYVTDNTNGGIYEIPVAGGYTNVQPLASGLGQLFSLTVDESGNVFFPSITFNNQTFTEIGSAVKLDLADAPSLSFASTNVGSDSTPQDVTLLNIGNAPLNITQFSVASNFQLGAGVAFRLH